MCTKKYYFGGYLKCLLDRDDREKPREQEREKKDSCWIRPGAMWFTGVP